MAQTADEKFILSQWKTGNPRALSALYDKYSGALYGVIIRICRDEALAQDLLQETFITLWQKREAFNSDKGRFYTWAHRIARNKTLNALRNPDPLIQMEDLSVYNNKGDEESTKWEYKELIGILKTLEDQHQRALELVYFQGFTHREAHKEMNVPLGTFKSYVRQALNELRSRYPEILFWIFIGMKEMI